MNKFKVGDKIKIIINTWGHLGQTMKIEQLPVPQMNTYIVRHPKSGNWTYNEHNLQLIKKPKHQVFNI